MYKPTYVAGVKLWRIKKKGMERTCKGRNWMKLVEEELIDCLPHSLWPIRPVARCGRRLPKPRSQEGWWQRCERIVEEVELCRRVRAQMASECWFWPLLLQFLCSPTVMVQVGGWTPPFYRDPPLLMVQVGVRPLHFIETHLASKGPVVARCGRRLPKPRSQEG